MAALCVDPFFRHRTGPLQDIKSSGEKGQCQRVACLGFVACSDEEESNFYDPPQRRRILVSKTCLGGEKEASERVEINIASKTLLISFSSKYSVYQYFSLGWHVLSPSPAYCTTFT